MDEIAIRKHLSEARRYAREAAQSSVGVDEELEEDRITLNELAEAARKPQESAPKLEFSGPVGIKLSMLGVGGWQVVATVGLIAAVLIAALFVHFSVR